MTPEDSYQPPFDTEDSATEESNPDESSLDGAESVQSADQSGPDTSQQDWENAVDNISMSDGGTHLDEDPEIAEIALPYIGLWNRLISTTNWEKGRIVSDWRDALIESGAKSQQYSDEAWANRVGGVTAPHVGRLRRVHDRFVSSYETYDGLYWSHFLAALDWDDAPLWLEGASKESWSVSQMRDQRWQALGAVESDRPLSGEIVVVDTDEDVVLPAQGGGRTREYGDEPGAASGPAPERPDFGDEDELTAVGGSSEATAASTFDQPTADESSTVQPFAGLPELPDDLSDAIESLKLAVLRHKTASWADTTSETVQKYLDAVSIMMR